MNSGGPPRQIPGFYYDEEKRKYFRIQDGHQLPTKDSQKYSSTQVKREKRNKNKRRRVERDNAARARHTIHRSKILTQPTSTAFALQREIGSRPKAKDFEDLDAFFVSNLRSRRLRIEAANHACQSGGLFDAVPCDDGTGRILLAYNHGTGGSSVYATILRESKQSNQPIKLPHADRHPVTAFTNTLMGLHAVNQNLDGESAFVALTHEPRQPGNIYIGGVTDHDPRRDSYLTLGSNESSLWSSAQNSSRLAISGTSHIYILDLPTATTLSSRLALPQPSRAVSWLADNHTIAYGTAKGIGLWDSRSEGTSLRFPTHSHNHTATNTHNTRYPCTQLHRSLPTTGLHYTAQHQLVSSTNTRIAIYDLRFTKPMPVFTWNHQHQSPRLQFDVCGAGNVLAALDAENVVQMYSLRSGTALGALALEENGGGGGGCGALMHGLRWIGEDGGSGRGREVLQTCRGTEIVRWEFGGREE